MSRTCALMVAAGALLLGAASTEAGIFVTLDQRENLNVLNSSEVTITSLYPVLANNSAGSELRGVAGETSSSGIGWFSAFTDTQKESFTMDLGRTRNVKTIRSTANSNGTLRSILSATVEVSGDGVNWSGPLSHATSYHTRVQTNQESRFVLNSAVNTRYLRLTGDSYSFDSGGFRQVGLVQLAVYGDSGTALADPGLDLISSDAWTTGAGGGVIITTTASTQPEWLTGMAADNETDSANRQLVYDMNVGDTITATFNSVVESIGRVGIGLQGSSAKNVSYRFLGSTDGVNFSTILYTHDGNANPATYHGPQFFDLPQFYDLKAIQFEVTDLGSAPKAYLVDFFAFQVPEPASAFSLPAIGALLCCRRRRNRPRA